MISNYQGRTKTEEHRFGLHSLYKMSYLPIDALGNEAQFFKSMLSFYNRTNPKSAILSLKKYVDSHNVKIAFLIDNQTDELLQVYENGVWRIPNASETLKHDQNSWKR